MNNPLSSIPLTTPNTVQDVVVYESHLGPWDTKSGGKMNVIFAFPQEMLARLNDVDKHELSLVPELELGFRAFHSSGLKAGSVGGKHFHRIKQETIALAKGKVEFLMEDVYGGVRTIVLDDTRRALLIPPFVMHTYTVLEDAELIGVSNTLYDADNPATHDTYEQEVFDVFLNHYR